MKTLIAILLIFAFNANAQITRHALPLSGGGTAPWNSADSLKVLTSNGHLAPSWQALSGGSGILNQNDSFQTGQFQLNGLSWIVGTHGGGLKIGTGSDTLGVGLDIGADNTLTGTHGLVQGWNDHVSGNLSAVIAGESCTASGHESFATGINNEASGDQSFVTGYGDTAEAYQSEAHGSRAVAYNSNSCVWGDGSAVTYDDAANEFIARASGGFELYNNANPFPSLLLQGDNFTFSGAGLISLDTLNGNDFIITAGVKPIVDSQGQNFIINESPYPSKLYGAGQMSITLYDSLNVFNTFDTGQYPTQFTIAPNGTLSSEGTQLTDNTGRIITGGTGSSATGSALNISDISGFVTQGANVAGTGNLYVNAVAWSSRDTVATPGQSAFVSGTGLYITGAGTVSDNIIIQMSALLANAPAFSSLYGDTYDVIGNEQLLWSGTIGGVAASGILIGSVDNFIVCDNTGTPIVVALQNGDEIDISGSLNLTGD